MNLREEVGGFQVLHVLTLSGGSGEYGGPASVAQGICDELNTRGWNTHIYSGSLPTLKSARPVKETQSTVIVSPLLRRLPFSSLWSFRVPWTLGKQVRKADIVHIHFARELIPIFAALLCLFLKKPYVTQTHGMVISDKRKSIRVIDKFVTIPILNRSLTNFVLSRNEWNEMKPLKLICDFQILPNGIFVPSNLESKNQLNTGRIVFCSRIQSRKRPDSFLDLAKYSYFRFTGLSFEMYGPDGGELTHILNRIEEEEELSHVKYLGALEPGKVTEMLAKVDLMVLPSENEPIGMIVLEALSVGTSVLIMPSCGLSEIIGKTIPQFVAASDDLAGIIQSFEALEKESFLLNQSESIQSICRKNFSIENVVNQVICSYELFLDGE